MGGSDKLPANKEDLDSVIASAIAKAIAEFKAEHDAEKRCKKAFTVVIVLY